MLPFLEAGEPLVDLVQGPLLTGLAIFLHAQFEVLYHREARENSPVFGDIANTGMGNLVGLFATEGLAVELYMPNRRHQAHYGLAQSRAPDPVTAQEADDLPPVNGHVGTTKDVALAVVGV